MSKTSKKATALSRKARIEEMRRAERARERRNRIITITLSAVVVVGLAGWGAYAINSANKKEEQKASGHGRRCRWKELCQPCAYCGGG
ncbi:hypothetical protein [Streptomyces sp. NPDC006012]|uniref:hypothetical protein n=1 Tax=Streptomyces sp. NPDC006012 TaxID=3364739 RepID=UPI0036D0D2AD